MTFPLFTVAIRYEHDVVLARQRARQIAGLLGFNADDQTRMATAVSELARNAFQYAHAGKVEFFVEGKSAPQLFRVKVTDPGSGIANLQEILDGQYHSKTGMGLGIVGARRLVDQFHIESQPGSGTTVWLTKLFPKGVSVLQPAALTGLLDRLAQARPENPFEEMQRQNQELLRALAELERRQEELAQLNHELEDTNRGVVALYAELDEKADHLRRADELKSRFLSNMSHEFRTPLNCIQALCHILLDRTDGPLTSEQVTQLTYVQKSADDLFELVNDLLDIAKIEAGKVVIRPAEFDVATLFSALRGMLRPLLLNSEVQLIIEEPSGMPMMQTDEGKVSQILRNFLSNALKFTTKGEVRLTVSFSAEEDVLTFSVVDTGIGIPAEDHERIFLEFAQVDNAIQQRVKGTGLGLPLSKKLAELLGGTISVESRLGMGSRFSVRIPRTYREPGMHDESPSLPAVDPSRIPVLLVEDEIGTVVLYENYLKQTVFQLFPVRTLSEARRALDTIHPKAIILDILLRGEDSWLFLSRLKSDRATKGIPILVVTSNEDQQKGLSLGADAYCVKPVDRYWLLSQLTQRTRQAPDIQVLVIDDDLRSRYVLKSLFRNSACVVMEAVSGEEGLRLARTHRPHAIVLDLMMPDLSGAEVLASLKKDHATQSIPVIIVTSQIVREEAHARLLTQVAGLLFKHTLTRDGLLAAVRQAVERVGLTMGA
ncbi:MAG TPA: ATP-binding protein [Nitrospiraceae bacterium]|nr:ATP-binding protein [Nitrospiraceae bacterium]